MTLTPRQLSLKPLVVKEKTVLALDTGFEAGSLEGIRLVKVSRGQGWFYHHGQVVPWVTRGVLESDRRLVIWGEVADLPPGASPAQWPQVGPEGAEFLKAFVAAWTARAGLTDRLPPFSPSAILPWRTEDGWAFAFPADELRGVLDSVQPLADRLVWDHYRLPDAVGASGWAFASAALGVFLVAQNLPWTQGDEEHLRQEVRVLKRTLVPEELPSGLDEPTLQLWFDALTGREATSPVVRWAAWAHQDHPLEAKETDRGRSERQERARRTRERRRQAQAFWRRRGALVAALAAGTGLGLALAGTVIWGVVKPDPTDSWTPQEVVNGYYAALNDLDSEALRKITSFDSGQEPQLAHDQEEVTNRYVIRQVRTAYEHGSPVVEASAWEAAGKPPVDPNKMLYGLTDVVVHQAGDDWEVSYQKWASEPREDKTSHVVGSSQVDHLRLKMTDRGWKITSLRRETQPLP